jgi:hypothetical protein
MAVIGVVLLFLLTLATNNRELYERNYGRLFAINVVVAGPLLLVILWIMVRLSPAAAPGEVWQPPAGQAGRHLCAGGLRPAC